MDYYIQNECKSVCGAIVNRRCFGKHLSFATLVQDDGTQVKIAFRRAQFQFHDPVVSSTTVSEKGILDAASIPINNDDDSSAPTTAINTTAIQTSSREKQLAFPVKSTDMPYGARVQVQVVVHEHEQQQQQQEKGETCLYEVKTWKLLGAHPRNLAIQAATTQPIKECGNTAVSCSDYLRVRSEIFMNLPLTTSCHSMVQSSYHCNNKPVKQHLKQQEKFSTQQKSESKGEHHGNGGSKRAKIFADWLMDNLLPLQQQRQPPPPRLANNHDNDDSHQGTTNTKTRVPILLDIAGGKGHLSVELARMGILCTVIDPLVRSRRSLKKLVQSRKSNLSDVQSPYPEIPSFVAAYFERNQVTAQLVAQYDILVGFHPDECTETIVDMALQQDKAFAIVPCCVFPSLSPTRTLRGKWVQTYDDFLEYLMAKDPRIRQATLPIEGKNRVIYLSHSGSV